MSTNMAQQRQRNGYHADVKDDSYDMHDQSHASSNRDGKAIRFKVHTNNDSNNPGKQMVFNLRYYRNNFDSFLDDLTDRLNPRFGAVQRVFTARGSRRIESADQLPANGTVVATGNEKFVFLEYSKIPPLSPRRNNKKDFTRVEPVTHANDPRYRALPQRCLDIGRQVQGLNIKVHYFGNDVDSATPVLLRWSSRSNFDTVLRDISDRLNMTVYRIFRILHEGVSDSSNFEQILDPDQLQADDQILAMGRKGHPSGSYWIKGKLNLSNARDPSLYDKSPRHKSEGSSVYKYKNPLPSIGSTKTTNSPSSHPPSQGKGSRDRRSKSKQRREVDYDEDRSGRFRSKQRNNHGAKQVKETKETRTDRPIDQMEAEVVSEEEIHTKEKTTPIPPGTELNKQPSHEQKQNSEAGNTTRANEVNKNKNKGKNGADKSAKAKNGEKPKAKIGELPPVLDETETKDTEKSDNKDSKTYRKEGDDKTGEAKVKEGHVQDKVEQFEDLAKEVTPNPILQNDGDVVQSHAPLATTPPKGSLNGADSASERKERLDQDMGNQHYDDYQDDSFNQRDRNSSMAKNKEQRSSTPQSRGEARNKQQDDLEDKAASRLQAGFRGHKTRKEFRAKKQLQEDQARNVAEEEHEREQRERDEREAMEREEAERQYEKEQHSATVIQASFRGHKQRREYKLKKQQVRDERERSERENYAATKIQSGYRGYKVRQEYNYKKRQTEENKIVTDEKNDRQDQAATKIQSSFRGYKTRKDMNLKRNAKKLEDDKRVRDEKAASKIQAGFKGYKVRKDFNEKKKNKPDEAKMTDAMAVKAERESAAASRIQAGYKGYKTRKELSESKKNALEERKKKEEVAATRIQASYKGYRIRKDMSEQRKRAQLPDPVTPKPDNEVEKAATKIQSGYRGYKARKEFKSKVIDTGDDESDVDQLPDSAVSRHLVKKDQFIEGSKGDIADMIQCAFRGYHARKVFMEKKKYEMSKMKIQAAYRGHIARESYNFEKVKLVQCKAATKIQATYRGYKVRKSKLYPVQAVVRIQAAFKGYVARKLNKNKHDAYKRVTSVEGSDYYATLIQSLCKGYITRHSIKIRREYSMQGPSKSNLGTDRSKQSNVSYWEDSNIKMYSDKTLRLAASTIQSAYQTFRTRKSHREWKARQLGDKLVTHSSETEQEAATKIQSCFRGHLVRKTMRNVSETESKSVTEKCEKIEESKSDDLKRKANEHVAKSSNKQEKVMTERKSSAESMKSLHNEKGAERNSKVSPDMMDVRQMGSPCEVIIDGKTVTPVSRPVSGRNSTDSSKSVNSRHSSKKEKREGRSAKHRHSSKRPKSSRMIDVKEGCSDKKDFTILSNSVELAMTSERKESPILSPTETRESASAESRTSSRPVSSAMKRDSSGRVKSKSSRGKASLVNDKGSVDLNITVDNSFTNLDNEIVTDGKHDIVRTSTQENSTIENESILSVSDVVEEKTQESFDNEKSKHTHKSSAKTRSSSGEVEKEGDSVREIEDDAGELSSIEKNVTAISQLQAAFKAYKMRREISELLSGGGELMDIRKIDRAVSALRKDFRLRSNKVRRLGSYQFGTGKKANWDQNWWEADELENPKKDVAATTVQAAFRSYQSRQLYYSMNKTIHNKGQLKVSNNEDKDLNLEKINKLIVDENDSLNETDGGESLNRTTSEKDLADKKIASAQIEAAFRGFRTRETEKQRVNKAFIESEKSKAKSQIEASFRGYRTRQTEQKRKLVVEENDSLNENDGGESLNRTISEKDLADKKIASAQIEAAFQGFKTREAEKQKVNKALIESENKAKSQIEASFRGYRTRQAKQKRKLIVEENDSLNENDGGESLNRTINEKVLADKKIASAQIEAAFQGFRTKEAEKQRVNKALTESVNKAKSQIEASFRGYRTRQAEQKRILKSRQSTKSDKTLHVEMHSGVINHRATQLQAAFAGHQTRKVFISLTKMVEQESSSSNRAVVQNLERMGSLSETDDFKLRHKSIAKMHAVFEAHKLNVENGSSKLPIVFKERQSYASKVEIVVNTHLSEKDAFRPKSGSVLENQSILHTVSSPKSKTHPDLLDEQVNNDSANNLNGIETFIQRKVASTIIQSYAKGFLTRQSYKNMKIGFQENSVKITKENRGIKTPISTRSRTSGKETKEEKDLTNWAKEEMTEMVRVRTASVKLEAERRKVIAEKMMLAREASEAKECTASVKKQAEKLKAEKGLSKRVLKSPTRMTPILSDRSDRGNGAQNESAVKIQKVFRGYRVRKKANRQKKLDNEYETWKYKRIEAAVTIQSGWRGYQVRKELKEEEEMLPDEFQMFEPPGLLIINIGRTKSEIARAEKRHENASMLQLVYRASKERRKLMVKMAVNRQDKHASASKIQALVRGFLTRRRLKLNEHASSIQVVFKGFMSRESMKNKKLKKLEEMKNGATVIQAAYWSCKKRRENEEAKEERRRVIEMNEAAVDIQSGFRGFAVREEMAKKKLELQEAAADKIQSSLKGYRLRVKMREKKKAASVLVSAYRSYKRRQDLKLYKEKIELERVAATKLQSAYKGYIQRLETRLRNQKRAKENKAASCIQSILMGRKARKDFKRRKEERQAAVLKIQSVYRGHQGRKVARQERYIAEVHNEAKLIIDLLFNRSVDYLLRRKASAERIQATFKGYCTRTKLAEKLDAQAKEKHRSATHIQTIVRARQARLQLEKRRQLVIKKEIAERSATCIQAVVRAKQGREILEKRKQLVIQNASAAKIQSLFRGYSARKELDRERAIISRLKPPTSSVRTRSGRLLELTMDGVLMKNARAIIVFHKSATELQDAFRAYKTRREMQNRYVRKLKITENTPRREKSMKMPSPEYTAAVMIQKTFRGYSDRKAYDFMVRDKCKHWNNAATCIQASVKGYLKRRAVRQRRMRLKSYDRDEEVRIKDEAADLISYAYRSMKRRSEKVSMRAEM